MAIMFTIFFVIVMRRRRETADHLLLDPAVRRSVIGSPLLAGSSFSHFLVMSSFAGVGGLLVWSFPVFFGFWGRVLERPSSKRLQAVSYVWECQGG